jgi:Zn-dependent protease with chaperone function
VRAAEVMAAVAVQGLVAAGMVEALIRLWRVEAPEQALQLRRLALILPLLAPAVIWLPAVLGLPLPAPILFDVRRWLNLTLPGGSRLGVVAAAVAMISAALFTFQEFLPAMVRHPRASRGGRRYREGELAALDAALAAVAPAFGGRVPPVWIADDGGPMACVAGPWRPRLLISRRLVALLAPGELRAALAHEAAHTLRHDLRTGWAWFGLRAIQCFSPAALLEFRWTLRDQERACDRVAAARTGEPASLASALRKVHAATAPPRPAGAVGRFLVRAGTAWEERVARHRLADLQRGELPAPLPWWRWRLAAAASAVIGVLVRVR